METQFCFLCPWFCFAAFFGLTLCSSVWDDAFPEKNKHRHVLLSLKCWVLIRHASPLAHLPHRFGFLFCCAKRPKRNVRSWKAPTDGGNERIFGLHVSNGSRIWQYTPEVPVWNFAPLFPADGSVVFMDWTGGVYRLNLTTGEEIWKVLAESNKSFGDGGVALSETMVYSCSNFGHFTGDEGTPGVVRAFYLSNGTEVWSKFLEMPCNSYPAVGHLAGFDQLALVVTPGSFMDLFHHVGRALRGEVLALDALTGAQLWRYPVAPYDGGPIGMAVGDFEGFPARVLEGIQLVCYPAHWSAPLIDGSGQVLVGRADGNLHWILGPEVEFPNLKRTANMTVRNGLLSEVRHLGSGFIHGAISAGPGLFAISTCDTLFVFQK